VSASDGTTYEYTARGTLSKTTVGTVGLDTVSDAFGQVIKQYSTATAFSQYDYDGLGRVVQAGFAYTGLGNDLAKDATSTYVRDPGGAVAGSKTGAWAVYAWTDLHTDVVGQFSAAATTLAGSTTYEPYGKVSTSTGMQGNLGYQSGWTDSQTKRVNMHARWYNPDTGQFDSRDTDSVPNRFNYADNNPLVNTDPTGHGPVNYRDRELVSGVPGVGARYVNDDWEHWQTHRRNQRAYEQQQKLIAKENARVAKLIRELPSCMKQEKKVQGRPVEEAAGCEGAMKTCDKATGSRFARYESDQTTMLKNCTRVDVNPDGSCAINDFFFKKSDSRCQDPKLIAAMIDNFVGRRGGYMPDGQPGDRAHLTGILVNRAVEGVAAQRTAEKVQACQADRWCRNRETISTVVEVVVAVAFTAACTVATGGVGLPLCAVIGAGIGGFTGGVAEARAEGLAWDDPWLWDRGVNRGIAAAAMAAALAPIGGLLGLAARPLASLVGRLLATSAGRTIAGTGARLAEVKAIQTLGNVARSRWGSCALDVGTEVGMAVATAAHSFAPHTKVLKGDGTTTKIKDIKLGDKVVATDPATDQTSTQPVTALHVNLDRDLVDVEVRPTHSSGEGGGDRSTHGPTSTLHTTSHHPLWDTATNQWVNAANLKPGHSTLTGPDGQTSQVVTVRKVFGFNQMHDLTVDNIHTYYVMAGDSPVLVHNCNGSTNSHLDGLPVHPDINKFNVRAGELVNNRFETHPLNPHQMNGGEVVGHDGVRNLRNDQLIMPGGPQGNDPIRGTRDWAPGDCSCFPGSRIYITGGHHRTAEIARRVQAGDMDPNTLIEFWISPP